MLSGCCIPYVLIGDNMPTNSDHAGRQLVVHAFPATSPPPSRELSGPSFLTLALLAPPPLHLRLGDVWHAGLRPALQAGAASARTWVGRLRANAEGADGRRPAHQ